MLEGLKDFYFKELQPLPQSAEATGVWPFTGNPRAWIDPTDPNYEPSIYADRPSIDVTGSGTIKSITSKLKGSPLSYNAFKKMTGINSDEAIKEVWEDFQAFSKNKSLPGEEMFEAWMSKHRTIQDMLRPDTGKFLKRKGLVGESGEKSIILYRGFNKDLIPGKAIYLSDDPIKASTYPINWRSLERKTQVEAYYTDIKNPKIFTERHKSALIDEKDIKNLKDKGYDGIKTIVDGELIETIVFNKSQLKKTKLSKTDIKRFNRLSDLKKIENDTAYFEKSVKIDELDALIKEADDLIK